MIVKDDLWKNITISDQLTQWAMQYGDKTALTEWEKNMSYAELDQLTTIRAGYLRQLGLCTGDFVLLQLPNSIEFVITFFAIIRAQAIPILCLPANRENELEGIAKKAKPKMYIYTQDSWGVDYEELGKTLVDKFDFLKTMISVEEICDKEKDREYAIDSLDIAANQPALFLLSGGTTSVPKLIPRTHADYMYVARKSAEKCQLTEESVYLAALPLAHNFPLCCPGMLGTFCKGGRVVICNNSSPDEIVNCIMDEGVTVTALVPSLVSMCMDFIQADDEIDLSSLKLLQVGGAFFPEELARKTMKMYSAELMQVYGMSEGLICFTELGEKEEEVVRTQGKPISEYDEVLICDEKNMPVKHGCEGQLLTKGPYTISEYYMAEKENAESFSENGYFMTGDKARIDKNGNIQILGRVKEVINRCGEKIVPSEIEGLLCEHPLIKDAAVIGIPDEKLGQCNCAVLILKEGTNLNRQDIFQYLQSRKLSDYKIPDRVEVVERFPLTAVGKVDKKKMLEVFQ